MSAPTTGVTSFNLDLSQVVEEAFERCGVEARTGYHFRTARRSLNLLLIEWANRGINLWTIDEGFIPLLKDVGTYDLPLSTVDLIEHLVRTEHGKVNQTDLSLTRIGVNTYADIPNKISRGRPLQIWVERRTGAMNPAMETLPPRVHLWPIPDISDRYTLIYYRLRRMEDAGNAVNGQDIPFRFLPALTAGLAWHLSGKIPEAAPLRQGLKMDYEEAWGWASEEDREKATLKLYPRNVY